MNVPECFNIDVQVDAFASKLLPEGLEAYNVSDYVKCVEEHNFCIAQNVVQEGKEVLERIVRQSSIWLPNRVCYAKTSVMV